MRSKVKDVSTVVILSKNKQAAKSALEQHISNSLTSAIKSIEAYEKVTETTESK